MFLLNLAGYDIGSSSAPRTSRSSSRRARSSAHDVTTRNPAWRPRLLRLGTRRRPDHIGIVEKVCGGGVFSTIEGNTSSATTRTAAR
jgi:hypothetical protein